MNQELDLEFGLKNDQNRSRMPRIAADSLLPTTRHFLPVPARLISRVLHRLTSSQATLLSLPSLLNAVGQDHEVSFLSIVHVVEAVFYAVSLREFQTSDFSFIYETSPSPAFIYQRIMFTTVWAVLTVRDVGGAGNAKLRFIRILISHRGDLI